MREQRTEIYPQAWQQCYRCRKPTLMHELIGRQDVTGVTRGYSWIGFPLFSYHHYGIVSICPTCNSQEIEALKTRRIQTSIGVGAGAVILFGWQYLGVMSLISAALVTIGGAYCRWRSQRKQLVHWRKEQ